MLLNQQKRFEALDFCSHIVKVYDVDPRDETVAGVVSFNVKSCLTKFLDDSLHMYNVDVNVLKYDTV